MTLDHNATSMTLDISVALHTTVAFVISLVALLISSSVMCHKEQLWNFMYSKEYTFSILLNSLATHCKPAALKSIYVPGNFKSLTTE
jgi:hypothetical protein